MSHAYCNTCKEIIPLKCHIKKAVCTCGSKDVIGAYSRWSDKIGWDYFDSQGRFLKFVAHVPYDGLSVEQSEVVIKKPVEQLKLL